MEKGGNSNFREFLRIYNLEDLNIHSKYRTGAAKFYRQSLDAKQKGEQPRKRPSEEEGRKVEIPSSTHLMVGTAGFGSDDLRPKKKRSRSRFKEGWEKGKKKVEKWGSKISEKFGKIFKRSRSRKKKDKKGQVSGDVSASNDSYFEIKSIKKSKKADKQNRFDEGLISFKKKQRVAPAKPFPGWKKYSEKGGSKVRKDYRQQARAFKSQTSKDEVNDLKNFLTSFEGKNARSFSDNEKVLASLRDANRPSKGKKVEGEGGMMGGDYQDPFQKKLGNFSEFSISN